MTWLLAQIGLPLLLAVVAGGFVGWYLRALRDRDRVEDLRQTMLAIREVKDQEVNELRRRAEDLEMRLADASDSGARPDGAPEPAPATAVEVSPLADETEPSETVSPAPPLVAVAMPARISKGEKDAAAANAGVAAAERERRREAEAALRRKAAAVLTLQAEVEALREAVADKAAEIAQLQDGLAGAEPAGRELESTQAEITRLEARLRVMDEEQLAAIATAAAREAELTEVRKEVVIRDTRINDLRNRCASLETELTAARDAASSPGTQDLGRAEDDADVRRALQRQIERNRKQEAVHRAVVEQLEGEKARLRAATQAIPERTNRK